MRDFLNVFNISVIALSVVFCVKDIHHLEAQTKALKSQIITLQSLVATLKQEEIYYTLHGFTATAYSLDNGSINHPGYRDGLTSTGLPANLGVVAVDPDVIPYGSVVFIPQLKRFFIALDTGSAIKGKHIDIFFKTKEEALKFGKQTVDVAVCGKANYREVRDDQF